MTCETCNGAGHVPGHWMPELCPACSGTNEIPEAEDKTAKGCCAVTVIFLAVCALIGLWSWLA